MATSPVASATAVPKATEIPLDLLTVAAIAIVTYLLCSLTHEALGHGLAALLVGTHIQHLSSVDLAVVTFVGISAWQRRFVSAAGCGAQVLVALLTLGLLRLSRNGHPHWRVFLWLFSTANLIIPGGYLMVMTLLGIGDWNAFVQGLPSPLLWQTGLVLLGVLLSLLGLWLGARNLDPFVGRATTGRNPRRARRVKITYISYLAGSAAWTLSAVFNPIGPRLILISGAAASFGGTAFLLLINAILHQPLATTPERPLAIMRNWLWVGLGGAALLVYFVVLGPGVPR